MNTQPITVETRVRAPMDTVWRCWTEPEHIVQWAFASDDWEAPAAENDVRVGGRFKTVMAAKDKSASFDFTGVYTDVQEHAVIAYEMDDGRKVHITFESTPEGVHIVETFDPEQTNPEDMQRAGWQAILNTFAAYVEAQEEMNRM